MIPIEIYKTKLKRLLDAQAKYKEAINSNPKVKWMRRGTWTASIAWAAFLIVQSVPYYQAIAAGEADYKTGKYDEAVEHFKNALEKSNSFSSDDLRRAKALNNLAEIYRAKYQLADAETLYKKSSLLTEKLPKNRPEIPMAMHNLASIYRDEGRFREAEELDRKALWRYTETVKQDDGRKASILNGIGKALRDQAHYEEADEYYQEALQVQEHFYGKNEADNAGIIANIGGLRRDQGRYAEAEEQYKRALTLDSVALGPNHPYVATDFNNLGCLYRDENRFDEAQASFDKALAIRTNVFKHGSPIIAKTELGMAELAIRQRKYADAERLLNQVRKDQEGLAEKHLDRAMFYNLKGALYQAQGDAQNAIEYQNRCLAIRDPAVGPVHPDVAYALIDRARADKMQGKECAYRHDLERAKLILRSTIGLEHPVTKRFIAEFNLTKNGRL